MWKIAIFPEHTADGPNQFKLNPTLIWAQRGQNLRNVINKAALIQAIGGKTIANWNATMSHLQTWKKDDFGNPQK